MQIINATVRFPGGQPRVSQSGKPYVSALFTAADGTEYRVFAPPEGQTTTALQQLQVGQPATLALDAKGRAHYVIPDDQQQPMGFTAPPAVPSVQHQTPPVYQHHQAAPAAPAAADPALALADQWAAAFARLVSQGVPPEVAGPGASTILIQLGRR